jgi:hypothetical protein
MSDEPGPDVMVDGQEKQQLLEELQLARSAAYRSVCAVTRTAVSVTVRPADSMCREQVLAEGVSRELHSRSMVLEAARPVAIGGFFELRFDGVNLGLPVVFGRCDQITMLAEDRFEARFQFLQPVTLPESPSEFEG